MDILFQENASQNVICNMVAILFRPDCVKLMKAGSDSVIHHGQWEYKFWVKDEGD